MFVVGSVIPCDDVIIKLVGNCFNFAAIVKFLTCSFDSGVLILIMVVVGFSEVAVVLVVVICMAVVVLFPVVSVVGVAVVVSVVVVIIRVVGVVV